MPFPEDEGIFVQPGRATYVGIKRQGVIERIFPRIKDLFTESGDILRYRRNLIKVDIFYETFDYEIITEEAAYQLEIYLSNVGGMLALWLGCSVLSVFEYVELIIDLCSAIFAKKYARISDSHYLRRSGERQAEEKRSEFYSDIPEHDQKILINISERERERCEYIFKKTILEKRLLELHRLRHNAMIQY
ncbi:hypothetical protein LSH36_1149g00019 [Paralvinella palmiformis]|uniref:Uncharacterized protein n=1 Tax=Paralvinella palmiformis TaxID=53620 RepID=A0AAD9IV76_9ANNE|nr:hypothetical protein LSH36_1149g00019 [Paralvinella palmiformis]